MAAGDDHTITAARRLRLLETEFTTRRRAPRTPGTPPGPRPVHAPALIDLDLLDYLDAAVHEVTAAVHTAVPDADPAPPDHADVYAWQREQIADLAPELRRIQEALVVRQSLEHAVRMDDHKAIRVIACPACECWGLFWRRERNMAVCVNRYCMTDGRPSTWTLRQLAHTIVSRQAARRAAN